jgi:hypothetical protein
MTPMIQPLQEFLKSHHYPADFGATYWLIGGALGVLGAVMVWLLKETDVKKALILGLSLPAFFTSLGGALQNSGGSKIGTTTPTLMHASVAESGATGIFSFFVSSAFAQPAASPTPRGTLISVKVSRVGTFAYKLEPLDSQGNILSNALEVKESDSSPVILTLPNNAVALRFTAGDALWTQGLSAKPGQEVDVTLKGEELRRKFDAAQVFGKTPELAPEKLRADIKVNP